ncbi:alcohol acetyltransferase [Cokeromyces recurvatus]|uniref:alcohol acetyltransferase n=1 Tax=Cokeromyces recurvatus TaxID=90255 RepID=UPI002220A53E|nr:alcohol acetyltransferase [Cokeromyces recurvatus]KAI7899356.1 alcohol acetyltransferase [Cokeromyces recurvatus]
MNTETYKERPLGLLEKYQLSKHLTNAYGNITLTLYLEHAPIQADQEELFYRQSFYPVLTQLIKRHPNLSIIVRDKLQKTAHFVQLSTIDLSKIVKVVNSSDSLTDLIRQETSLEFNLDDMLPLWRLTIVPQTLTGCNVIFTAHHIIADGMSLTIFWNECLKALNENTLSSITTTTTIDTIIKVQQHAIAPPYELSGAPTLSLVWDVVPVLCKNFLPKMLPSPLAHWIDPLVDGTSWSGDFAAVEGEGHKTKIQLISVPPTVWKPILDKAKEEQGVSGHAILFICLLIAWAKLYPNEKTEASTPINCRGLCNPPVPNSQIGNFVGGYTTIWTSKQLLTQSPWKLAKEYSQGLCQNKVNAAKQALFLSYLPQFPESFCDFWYDKRKYTNLGRSGGVEVSDLGRFIMNTHEEEDGWKLKDIYFCQSAQIFTNALTFNTVSANNGLSCTLSWQKGSLDETKLDQFQNVFLDILNKLK